MAKNQLVSFSLVILAAAVGQAHGIDICEKAKYVPLCRSVVKGATDPMVAIKTSIDHLILETKRARSGSVVMENKQAIKLCNENYDYAIGKLEYYLKNLKEEKASVKNWLPSVITVYGGCSDAVEEVSTFSVVKLGSKVVNTVTTLKHLATNCMHIYSLLK